LALASKLGHFNYDLLPALGALLTERSVTKAAEQLCISQPAMSGALQRLRDHFDDPLLVRVGREMELTPRAQALTGPVRELLLRTRLLLETGPEFDPANSQRRFVIALSDYAATNLLPAVSARLMREAPGVTLAAEPLLSPVYEHLDAGDLDLVVTAEDPRLDHNATTSHFLRQTLFTDRFVCVVAVENSRVGEVLSLAEYKALPHAVVRFGRGMNTIEADALQRLGMHVRVAMTTSSFTNLLFLIPGTDLICVVQERLARRFQPILPIRVLDPPLAIPDLMETLVWHPRADSDPGHAWLRELIRDEAGRISTAS
jgi:LysR family transcriptional regulator, nod-box dependent transcriptional activator